MALSFEGQQRCLEMVYRGPESLTTWAKWRRERVSA
jgi:hypothetical protein